MMVPLEIQDDLLTQAEASAKMQGVSFRAFVSAALRAAVAQRAFAAPRPFTQKAHDFGAHLESPWSLLSDLETTAVVARK